MTKFKAKAGPWSTFVGFILLVVFGLVLLFMGILEFGDIFKRTFRSMQNLESFCWLLMFFAMGGLAIAHGALEAYRIFVVEQNKKTNPSQPWFHSGEYEGFRAEFSPIKSNLYAILWTSGLVGLCGLHLIAWRSGSLSTLMKIITAVLSLGALIGVLFSIVQLWGYFKFGNLEVELGEMPITPGSNVTILSRISDKISREDKATFELQCIHYFHRSVEPTFSKSNYSWKTVFKVEESVPLQNAKVVDGKLLLETLIKIPDNAPSTDEKNALSQYRWFLKVAIGSDYELEFFAPVYAVGRVSEVKKNAKLLRVSSADMAAEKIS